VLAVEPAVTMDEASSLLWEGEQLRIWGIGVVVFTVFIGLFRVSVGSGSLWARRHLPGTLYEYAHR